MVKNFAAIGVGGFVAPRHLRAIRDTGNQLLVAVDPKDSVGILDQYSFNLGADVISEKPLVINPWNLDALEQLQSEYHGRISAVLQFRLHSKLIQLRESLLKQPNHAQHHVLLTYVTARGDGYHVSWKGIEEKSGGIAGNIGIYLFDLLIWLFGDLTDCRVYYSDPQRMSGYLELERAQVRWYLSIDPQDLPFQAHPGARTSYRSIVVDGEELEFTEGFTDLHTRVYQETLAGKGFDIQAARPSIRLVHRVRTAPLVAIDSLAHPFLVTKLHG